MKDPMAKITMLGETSIWALPKTAFLSSNKFSAGSVLRSYDWATEMKHAGRCVISGFHSKLETDVFELLLNGNTPVIWALARGLFTRPSKRVQEYLASGKLLIISQFDITIKERSRERATQRNQFVIDNADEVVFAHIYKGGMLSQLKIPDGVPLRVLDRE